MADDDTKVTRIRAKKNDDDGEEKESSAGHIATKYSKAPELAALAAKLIPSPGLALSDLADAKIAYEWTTGKQIGCGGFVSASLWPARMKPWGRFDLLLMMSVAQWQNATARVKEAALAHGLSHFVRSERGVWSIEQHPLEEFGPIAKRYGAWNEGGRVVIEQITWFTEQERKHAYNDTTGGNGGNLDKAAE
jgi:hypothetical protein